MSQERWHREIRQKEGPYQEESFWVTEFEPVHGSDEVRVRFMSVKEGNTRGLPEGVYVEANVTSPSYEASFDLRSLIRTHITLALREDKRVPGLGGLSLDLDNAMKFEHCFTSPAGGAVLRLEPALPSEVDEALHNLGTGQGRGNIVPTPRTQ